ncbi:MAG: protein-L-isoaspartate O-methyltransferase [Rhodobacteraceae bacterium]|nr:protein-L-isoaspartate O-methyltransferase [Paracoccaceae bacterium]
MTDYKMRRQIMVDTQVRPSDVTKFPIIDALLNVPREKFVPDGKREAAYIGENLSIGPSRVILEPRTLAKLLDVLDIKNNELVLDIGSGLGYSSAVISRMAELVIAVEQDKGFATEAEIPLSILNQLKNGGRIGAVFIEEGLGTARIGYKLNSNITWRYSFNAAVPVLEGFLKQKDFVL